MASTYNVREINTNDIQHIIDYWLKSDHKYLQSLGVDIQKLPSEEQLKTMLSKQISLEYKDKPSFAVIWEIDGKAVGHSNITDISFGNIANMHLHLWEKDVRQKGAGTILVKQSLPFFFELFQLKSIICEPYAENPAPNKTLEKVGFKLIKRYRTIPGSLNFEQDVNQWEIKPALI
ncbi:GNAT family protein [Flammeovirga sp. SubArs3]|uniref:GNAT family N-acetyltransferase n=1 Tax=Flammeovirga sp. SubArs3 TaxID=2995316 RepID=UPI00248B5594|nr:GNAT family protein [Flammeovirga sp. SubArs3]